MNRSALVRCATILWAALFCTVCAHAERPRMGVFHRDLDGDGLAERQVIVNDARPDGSIASARRRGRRSPSAGMTSSTRTSMPTRFSSIGPSCPSPSATPAARTTRAEPAK